MFNLFLLVNKQFFVNLLVR